MTFPTVTETTPRPEAVTRDTFLASDLEEGTAMRAREAAVTPDSAFGSPAGSSR